MANKTNGNSLKKRFLELARYSEQYSSKSTLLSIPAYDLVDFIAILTKEGAFDDILHEEKTCNSTEEDS